jgi:hypothetical protein
VGHKIQPLHRDLQWSIVLFSFLSIICYFFLLYFPIRTSLYLDIVLYYLCLLSLRSLLSFCVPVPHSCYVTVYLNILSSVFVSLDTSALCVQRPSFPNLRLSVLLLSPLSFGIPSFILCMPFLSYVAHSVYSSLLNILVCPLSHHRDFPSSRIHFVSLYRYVVL